MSEKTLDDLDRLDWPEEDFSETRQSYKVIAEAMHAAQTEIHNPKKDSTNPFFDSQYLSLPALLDLLRGLYNKHGVTIVQSVISGNGSVGCATTLLHRSGDAWTSGTLLLPVGKNDPQACGSAIKYARRYQLEALAGISGVDDDAESAMPERAPIRQPQSTEPQSGTIMAKVLSIGRKNESNPFVITTEKGEFTTYDKNVAVSAELAKTTGLEMEFKYVVHAKYGSRMIISERSKSEPT